MVIMVMWFSMVIPVVFCGYLWFSVVIPVVFYGYDSYQWFSMVIPVGYHGYQWLSLVFYGNQRLCMVIRCYQCLHDY